LSSPNGRTSTSTVRPFTAPVAGQLRTVLTRAPQRRDSAASGLPRKLQLKIRHESDYVGQLAGSAKEADMSAMTRTNTPAADHSRIVIVCG
jgi:hypothetical protein